MERYKRALELEPFNYVFHLQNACACIEFAQDLWKLKDYDQALVQSVATLLASTEAIGLFEYLQIQDLKSEWASGYATRATAYRVIGSISSEKGKAEEALKAYSMALDDSEKAIALYPSSSAYCVHGIACVELKDFKRAFRSLNKVLHAECDFVTLAGFNLVRAYNEYISDGKPDPNAPARVYPSLAAESLYRDKKYSEAISVLDEALMLDDEDVVAYNYIGLCHLGMKNHAKALSAFERAVELSPGYQPAYMNRGNTFFSMGNYALALDDFEKVIHLNPGAAKKAIAYFAMGECFYYLEKIKDAILSFDKSIELNLNYAAAFRYRGVSYFKLGNREQGMLDLKSAARLGDKFTQDRLRDQGITW